MILALCALKLGMSAMAQIPQEAAQFYAAYPKAQFTPIFKESLETFLKVESAYKGGKYKEADQVLKAFWAKHPPGTEEWHAANLDARRIVQEVGVNIGHPPCYYALRMFTECVNYKLSGKKPPSDVYTANLSVILVGTAYTNQPKTRAELEEGKGERVELQMDKRLPAADYKIIREATWLFTEYVEAATEGEMKVKLNFIPMPYLNAKLETKWDKRGFSGLSGEAWGKIWQSVPSGERGKTDWWWILYPSGVPDMYPDFKTAEFITGGMGVGPDGSSPCFIADDKWLVRRPPHLGTGSYTDIERRAYHPQWFQHEFFHHLYRIYPEHKLEVDGHDWFNLSKWPKDFVGRLEPDYYTESLDKRFKNSNPSLATRLKYAPPSVELFKQIKIEDVLGEYSQEVVQNGWHKGKITLEKDGKLRWTNAAGAGWFLEPVLEEGILKTGPDCPYYPGNPYFSLTLKRDAKGKYVPELVGFAFGGGMFKKQ